MTDSAFDRGVVRQWEARVRRMVIHGETRETILYALTEGNWPYDQATQLIRRTATRERWKAVAILIVSGLLGVAALGVTYASLTSPNGGVIYFPIAALVAFVYGLIRFIRVKA